MYDSWCAYIRVLYCTVTGICILSALCNGVAHMYVCGEGQNYYDAPGIHLVFLHVPTTTTVVDHEHESSSKPFLFTHIICLMFLQPEVVARHATEYNIRAIKFSWYQEGQLVTCGRDNVRLYRLKNNQLRGVTVRIGGPDNKVG